MASKTTCLLLAFAVLAASPRALAEDALRIAHPRLVLGMAVDHQFKNFAEVTYTDGSTAKVGDAVISFYAGAAIPLTADRRYELQATLGYRFAKANASNGDITYRDIPIEATLHATTGPIRLGIGPSLHLAPQLTGSGVASGLDVSYRTAVGAVGSAEWLLGFGHQLSLGARLTLLTLHSAEGSIDASGIGILMAGYI